MKIGVFGGTFDPVHLGHLIAASEVHSALGLDRLLWIPAAVPPHKRGRVRTSAAARLAMVRAAVRDDPRFEVDDLELRRPGPSYTVDTLRALGERFAGSALFLILGVDVLRDLHSWHQPDQIARLARLVVLARAGESAPIEYDVRVVEGPRIDISATDIRQRVAERRSIRYLVPDGVREIIEREGLYTE